MRKGLVISDAGPIISLAIIDRLEILNSIFDEIFIPKAVWEEVTRDKTVGYYIKIVDFFTSKVKEISGFNELTFVMDYGESESVMLHKEIDADYLLIDDKKARSIAENFGIKCIGTIGILSIARDKNLISELKPLLRSRLREASDVFFKQLRTDIKLLSALFSDQRVTGQSNVRQKVIRQSQAIGLSGVAIS